MKIYTRHTMKQPTNKLPYKRVKIIWVDICSSSQWYDDLKDVDDFTYSFCEDIGYLYSKDSKVVKIFTGGLFPQKPMLEFDTTEENIFISELSEEKFDIFDQVKNNNGFVKPLEGYGIGINPSMDFIKKYEI